MANKSIYEMTDEEIMSMDLPPEPDNKEESLDADDNNNNNLLSPRYTRCLRKWTSWVSARYICRSTVHSSF